MGWRRAADESEEYNLLWADSYIPFDSIASLNRYQKARRPSLRGFREGLTPASMAAATPSDLQMLTGALNLPALGNGEG